MKLEYTFKSKWADFDPNRHMRHSAYNDYAAEARVRFLMENGFDILKLNKMNLGPILFKEETNFLREINLGEDITVTVCLAGMSENGDRFKFQHQIIKPNGVVAAEVIVTGAWLDLAKRKLSVPPSDILEMMDKVDRTSDFVVL
ncbi:thioesterase family protein [Aureivirga sp. CE67]|uniref:thioesterase family protein n=1 Tax=Aureivirga sp. CE67 TaxID=1788983 RepID=UPI0018CBBBFF|nr:thioesterase family protein [Aureivirga sp. CE67]